jgi:hypothetical protein
LLQARHESGLAKGEPGQLPGPCRVGLGPDEVLRPYV